MTAGTAIAVQDAEVLPNETFTTTGGCRSIAGRVGGVELRRRLVITNGPDGGSSRAGKPGTDPTTDHPVHCYRHGLNRHVRRQRGVLAKPGSR